MLMAHEQFSVTSQ